MLIYTTIALILCAATLALTSSAVNETETDGFPKDNRNAFPLELVGERNHPVSTTLRPAIVNKHAKNESFLALPEESPILAGDVGRPTEYLSEGKSSASVKDLEGKEVSENSRTKLPKTRNASVVARKGVPATSKITARKGVGPELLTTMNPTTEAIEEAVGHAKSRGKNRENRIYPFAGNINVETANVTEKTMTTERTNTSLSLNNSTVLVGEISSDATTNSTKSSTIRIAPTKATKSATNSTTLKTTVKTFKPKPTVTIGEMEADKPIPASPTKTPPLGMPRKIDYIIPVIITIMALPLLGGATFFLYRRGRDCWDKRHYRRMDFLIDGMYNDYSWK